jgi:diketogulonate reductase-like aldo/keto reductase
VVIPKASSVEHLKANLDLDGWELSVEDMQEIDGLGVEMKVVDATFT